MAARRTISTIVTPASDTNLVTLDVVKDELEITDNSRDAKLSRYIAEASIAAQQFCNRIFAVQTIKDEFWPTRDPLPSMIPGGEEPLQLRGWPLVAVESVSENGTLLTENVDFRVDVEKGQLIRLDALFYPRKWPASPIAVQYTAGYEQIPADVSGKIARMVVGRFYAGPRDPSLKSEDIPGVRSVTYWVSTGADAGNLPPDVVDVLNNYRQVVIA